MTSDDRFEGVAIIGMTGRFPGADSVEEFWANLVEGKETISFFSDAELMESGLDVSELKRRGCYVPARGLLKDADCFDAEFFGVHPKEAEVMDPQQRVFLEACWAALERAGYPPGHMTCLVGVFGGATYNTYYQYALAGRPDLIELVGSDLVMFGNEKDYLTTRVAYKLGLKGPALNVCTACSTSLVAVAQACQSLLTYQCDLALAGGVSIKVPQKSGYYHDEGNIGSADGHTRSFDAQSSGTAFSNGVAVVVLKRMEDAAKDGDRIYAVIKSAALNNDGSQRVSFGAPGVEGQSQVIAMAHAMAEVDPETITCVEAHGTGTPLGDPIEVAALTKAFRVGTEAKQFCALGSVKSNIGHLDAAAGVAGLIKMALALHHKVIPPSLHFTKPNPKLDLEHSPFYVNAALQKWTAKPGMPRRAGVSSFGSGGTNAHVVVEEAPERPVSGPSRSWQLLVLSAKSMEALHRATVNLVTHLRQLSTEVGGGEAVRELADAAYTLQTGRSEFVHRRILVCRDFEDAATALDLNDPKRVFTQSQPFSRPPVVFMFPGQGAQYSGMGSVLYRTESVFASEVDRCTELLQPILQTDLRRIMFPSKGRETESDALLVQTRFTQPALFVIEYALAKLWMSWGIKPAAMIGHSVGEYVAGCLAGVFSLEDALMLVAQRGALVQAQPGGAMLAIRLPETEVSPLLSESVSIAAINSPNLCVASGPHEAIAALEKDLESRGVTVRHLQTSHAFHSAMMEPVLEPFTSLLKTVKLSRPTIPYVSNVSARWITPADAQSPDYWAGHVRKTVRFAEGVAELLKDPRHVLLEVGPGQTLCTMARQHPGKKAEQAVFASMPVAGDLEVRGITETLGRLWMTGVEVDWGGYHADEQRRRVVLPTYPFERKRYWPEPHQSSDRADVVAVTPSAPPCVECVPATAMTAPSPALLPTTVAGASKPTGLTLSRKERLLFEVRTLIQELSGYDLTSVDPSTNLLELGLDSLLLTQAAVLIQRKFGTQVSFRQLMEDLSSLSAIAMYLDQVLPAAAVAPETMPHSPRVVSVAETVTVGVPGMQPLLEQILRQQQALTNQILHLMGQQPSSASTTEPTVLSSITSVQTAPSFPALTTGKSHGPFKPIDGHASTSLTDEQQRGLDALIERYTHKTRGSKKRVGENRSTLADPRSVSGFNRLWKEMVYPIVSVRSDGSKVWDVDGNEYIDFVMGFGANYFGHRPAFVVQAVREQLDRGFEIGPIQTVAYEVAALIKELTGMERVGFTNTGSEAVLAAMRVARTISGRDKIAVFAGAYHGIFDEVLFRPLTVNGEMRTAAIAPGIPGSALSQVLVLDYGNPKSIEILRARGSEIAAVFVEPVQARRLDLQPKEFLHQLRQVTQETGMALVFDEVVTGFRVHPGGAQALFGVRADLATYGKVVGGGLPIGVIAGSARYMDALDGGNWQYGDSSFPEVGVTFFAGTCVRHPLALASAKSVLTYLKQQGPSLQERLTERTAKLATDLRALIKEFHAPYHIAQFSSLMTLTFTPDQKLAGLLFYLLRVRGILIWENRNFIITTAHSESDLAQLVAVFRESLTEMQASGFLVASAEKAEEQPRKEGPGQGSADAGTSVLRGSSNRFPLTEAQKEIWLAAQMGGQAVVAYNESLKMEFQGDFNVEVFRRSAAHVIQRHPILFAKISDDGQWQSIGPVATVEIPLIDLDSEEKEQVEERVGAVLADEVTIPFNLMTGPLWRAKILRLSGTRYVVAWTVHHIVCDGWSSGVLIDELAKTYSAFLQGHTPTLEPPISFPDYASLALADGMAFEGAINYWKKQLIQVPPPLDLPTDRPRPLVRTARSSSLVKRFDEALYQSLKRTAGQNRTTMVVLLMAALKTLLYRLTGQTDLVVGLPVAGQAVTGQSCLVGHCVNLLPIRTHLCADSTFYENLMAVKRNVLDAYDHRQCTIGTILQHVHVSRSAGRQPLIEVIFNVERDPNAVDFRGVTFVCERNPKRASHYDMFLNFVEGPQGLFVEIDYNEDLFDKTTMEQWAGHFDTLLRTVATTSQEVIGAVQILTDSEHKELIFGLNDTPVPSSSPLGLHELFERRAGMAPESCAVVFEGRRLTYRELNRMANQVAHRLKALGAGPDILVGLFLERTPEMLVGILGILKSGAAYVPLDPGYPKERLRYIIEDSRAPIVLTQQSLLDQLPTFVGRLVCLDADWVDIAREHGENLPVQTTPQHLAYVLFTSGSTGRPKGVAIQHHSAVTFVRWTSQVFSAEELAGVLFSTSVCFDLSIFEIFATLNAGGAIILVPNALHVSRLSVRDDVTLINTVPSTITELLHMGGIPSSVKVINLAGEALSDTLVEQIYAQTGVEKVYNLYGPTEATTYSTYTLVRRGQSVSIGRPIANTQAFILDVHRNPVPRGVLGELYLAGDGLARGYFGRPDLTAERFVQNPFDLNPNARMYRTGDVCRWLPDRNIQYLGRLDHQIKLRGFRIELGEIEAVLDRYPGVRQSLVVAREDRPGQRQLVAYVVPETGVTLQAVALREHVKSALPEFMLPTAFVILDVFPLSPNGKIDRASLPAPDYGAKEPSLAYVEPRDQVEQVLASIWAKVLRVERIGVHDNFFDLGGHSLLALRVIVEIEKLYDLRLPLATLLQAPTISDLATVLRKKHWVPIWSSLVPIRSSGSRPPLFLFHSHGGNVLEYYLLADLLDTNQPVYGVQAKGLDGNIPIGHSMETLVRGYVKELRSLQPQGPYYLSGFCFGGLAALEAARQLSEMGETVAFVGMIQTTCPAAEPFPPGMSGFSRRWYSTKKRIELEWENFRYRGMGHLGERIRRVLDVIGARVLIAFDDCRGSSHADRKSRSMAYILERLAMEHDRIYDAYTPKTHSGEVVLFRTRHQLPGFEGDRTLGWNHLLGAGLVVHDVPGHQQNVLTRPHVEILAKEFMRHLKQAQEFSEEHPPESFVLRSKKMPLEQIACP